MDINGWVDISVLIEKSSMKISLSECIIEEIIRNSDKQRFAISEDGLKIRATL
jgi:putative RNA 2'-phosphotransferase